MLPLASHNNLPSHTHQLVVSPRNAHTFEFSVTRIDATSALSTTHNLLTYRIRRHQHIISAAPCGSPTHAHAHTHAMRSARARARKTGGAMETETHPVVPHPSKRTPFSTCHLPHTTFKPWAIDGSSDALTASISQSFGGVGCCSVSSRLAFQSSVAGYALHPLLVVWSK
jgi:hypothetical protein